MKDNARAYRGISTLDCYGYRYNRSNNWDVSSAREDLFSFFFKPKLKIQFDDPKKPDVNTFSPSLQIQTVPEDLVPIGSTVTRRYIKVRIKNTGRELATNCEGELRITKWPDEVLPPSTDTKKLSWDQIPSANSRERNIRTRKQGELLNIVFVDSRLEKKSKSNEGNIYAYISTPEALTKMQNRSQDGLRAGSYEADLEIISDNNAYCKTKLSINIDSGYNSAIVKELK